LFIVKSSILALLIQAERDIIDEVVGEEAKIMFRIVQYLYQQGQN
jgi:hypothetical protein